MELQDAQLLTEKLVKTVLYQRPATDRRLSYYRGKEGSLNFVSKEFSDYCETTYKGLKDNWCAPVIQASSERIKYKGFHVYEAEDVADKELARVWSANNADMGFNEAVKNMLITGRSYIMVTPDEDDPTTPQITFLPPQKARMDTDPVTGKARSFLVVVEDDGMDYATLYTAETKTSPALIWKLQRKTGVDRSLMSSPDGTPYDLAMLKGGWEQRVVEGETFPALNPMGVVPAVEMRNETLLEEEPTSDLDDVIAMQDIINTIWAYTMNALDYASLPQRVVTGAEIPDVPVYDAAGVLIGSRPVELDKLGKNRILWIPDELAKIAEWTPSDLSSFSTMLDKAVEHLAARTRTPPHYLVAKMINTSAESLTIAEAGLVSKVMERLESLDYTMTLVNVLIATAMGDNEARIKNIRAGKPIWKNPQYRSEAQLADALLKKSSIGYPFEYILELAGEDPDEIPRIMQMVQDEKEMDPLTAIQNAMHSPGAPADLQEAPSPEAKPEPGV